MTNFKIVQNDKVIFKSDSNWLIPWFEFEEFLERYPVDVSTAEVHDKIVGKAVALLMLHFNVGSLHAGTISEPAQEVLDQASTSYTFKTMVKRIDCQTEEILKDINDPDAAYHILCKRAKRC